MVNPPLLTLPEIQTKEVYSHIAQGLQIPLVFGRSVRKVDGSNNTFVVTGWIPQGLKITVPEVGKSIFLWRTRCEVICRCWLVGHSINSIRKIILKDLNRFAAGYAGRFNRFNRLGQDNDYNHESRRDDLQSLKHILTPLKCFTVTFTGSERSSTHSGKSVVR